MFRHKELNMDESTDTVSTNTVKTMIWFPTLRSVPADSAKVLLTSCVANAGVRLTTVYTSHMTILIGRDTYVLNTRFIARWCCDLKSFFRQLPFGQKNLLRKYTCFFYFCQMVPFLCQIVPYYARSYIQKFQGGDLLCIFR